MDICAGRQYKVINDKRGGEGKGRRPGIHIKVIILTTITLDNMAYIYPCISMLSPYEQSNN